MNSSIRIALFRSGLLKKGTSLSVCNCLAPASWNQAAVFSSTIANQSKKEDFFDKNKRLQRPMSPHLTIYKPQLTAMLSITHRGTGAYLASALAGFSIGMLVLPGSFPYYLGLVEAMHFGPALIYLAKVSLAFPFLFHAFNGVRHLAWDAGFGFTLRTLYKSGYLVLGSSILLSMAVAAL